VNNLVSLLLLFSLVGGSLILFDYDDIFAQNTDFQLPSLSFSTPYSDMPSNMGGSLSELGNIDEDVDSQVKEIIKPTFQNPLEKFATKEKDEISSTIDSKGSGIGEESAPTSSSSDGNVYVVDYANIRVQKFNNQGDFISKWGTKGKADGQFGVPHGVDVDKEGNVYIVDMDNNNVQKFDSEGNFLYKWGSMGTGDGQFMHPHTIKLDSAGNSYVSDMANLNIQKFDSEGSFLYKWGSMGTGDGQFNAPEGVAIDSLGNIYVTDTDNNNVQKFDSEGNFTSKVGY